MRPIRKPSTNPRDLQRAINELIDSGRSAAVLESRTVRRNTSSGGTTLEIVQKAGGGGGKVEQFRVKSVGRDHLVCVSYSVDAQGVEEIGEDEVQIAKPYTFRVTPFHEKDIDGKHYEFIENGTNPDEQLNPWNYRLVTLLGPPEESGEGEEVMKEWWPTEYDATNEVDLREKIWPEYVPEKTIIYAVKVSEAPVVYVAPVLISAPGDPEVYSAEISCDYVDLNVDGRRWEMTWRRLSVCVEKEDGTTERKFVLVRCSQPFNKEDGE